MAKYSNMDQIYNITASIVMKEMKDFDNKEFMPKNIDECEMKLRELVEKKWLSTDWIHAVAEAFGKGNAIFINLAKDWKWTFLTSSGTKEELMEKVRAVGTAIEKKDKKEAKAKSPWGQNYFGGKHDNSKKEKKNTDT